MDSLLKLPRSGEMEARYGREAVKEEIRRAIAAGGKRAEDLVSTTAESLERRFSPTLTRAINATGVLLHTNLGRSPLSEEAREALARVTTGYSTLEYDPSTGGRGRRQDHVRAAARDLFGAGDALAVNNNASAIFLTLCALARGRRVLVSRGELVAIGGSFKIPEILESSGAVLVEVGTTNRTTIEDYRRAMESEPTALLLTVHPSNYEIRGYTRRTRAEEVAALCRETGVPWVHDQGTGCVAPLEEFGVEGEATVASCLEAGADLVTFSADKLFGGPQAGFVVGRAGLVAVLAAHPVARVVRPDKMTLACLSATLAAWKTGRWRELPVYRAAASPIAALEGRGEKIRDAARRRGARAGVEVVASTALFGGGTSPEKPFPSRALAVSAADFGAEELARRLREMRPPIVARIEADRVLLDLRSIDTSEDGIVADAIVALEGSTPGRRPSPGKPGRRAAGAARRSAARASDPPAS